MKISPRMLDWIVNGVPVYIRKHPDGTYYATTEDFSKYLTDRPVETVRLEIEHNTPASWKPEQDERVLAKLREYNK